MKKVSLFYILLCSLFGFGQDKKEYQIRTIAFYNLENLFDTTNDSLVFDDDRTPTGKDNWTEDRYWKKIENLSRVLSDIGSDNNPSGPDLLGVCEAENRTVLEDLINHPLLKKRQYGIVHFDSPDERGIDVGLLFAKSSFIPISFVSRRLLLTNEEGFRDYTRDQLVVEGLLDNEKIYVIVNHWPSRSGGELRSRPYRLKAAELNWRIIDSLRYLDPSAKIISMGDFNDDPISPSFKKILKVRGKEKQLDSLGLFGPMENLFKKGIGSLAYRDQWNLFDQIYLTANLVNNPKGYRFWKADVFNPPYLIDPKGMYKGYPLRTYAGGSYIGGYSDHFPVFVHLIREVK
ncbi:endonuclease/exonuclease/phosphatase family protein [Maribacter algicola]|nr:endonuclease/exonuclease/phosphatase family protein [Maribacter algicola]